jgi:hypothetical protein
MVFSEGSIDEVTEILSKEIGVPRNEIKYETITYKKQEHHVFYNGNSCVYTYFAVQEGINCADEFYMGIFIGSLKTDDGVLILADTHEKYQMGQLSTEEIRALEKHLLDGKLHRVIIGIEGKGDKEKKELCRLLFEVSMCLRHDLQGEYAGKCPEKRDEE